MRVSRGVRQFLTVGLVVGAVAGLAPRSVDASPARHHCVIRIVGERPSGQYVAAPVRCYATFAQAMAAVGVDTSGLRHPTPPGLVAAGRFETPATFDIGIHYDGANWTGSSITVTGSDCSGGWLNLSTAWINRISSTLNGCPVINHFDGYNLAGSSEQTIGLGGNLGALNNKTNSIQYTS